MNERTSCRRRCRRRATLALIRVSRVVAPRLDRNEAPAADRPRARASARAPIAGVLLLLALAATACSTQVQVTHSPIVATVNDQITFTARTFTNTTPDSIRIQILVNAVLVQTCASSPCTFTGGPYPTRKDGFVSYAANVEATYTFNGKTYTQTHVDGYYFTGVTDASYNWNSSPYLYARYRGSTADREDLAFHMADDYASNGKTFADFIADATDKVQNKYGAQDLIRTNLDKFNFWLYKKPGSAAGCGTVHADAASDMSFRDDDVVLHETNLQDCTNAGLSHFSAEGSTTKAFLHESGHGVFGLGDEYDGPTNYSITQSPEPNIFSSEALCRGEQTAKGRNADACYEFTTRDGGWWGIHTGTTIMTTGNLSDAWFTEATERVLWYFKNM